MSNGESPQSSERVIPHIDDGYTDGAIGPMYGTQRLSLSAKQLPHGGEEAHRKTLWVGIPWRIILTTCAAVAVTLLVFGLLVSLLAGRSNDSRFTGDWYGHGVGLTIDKTDSGWDVITGDGQPLHATERDGQLVASTGGVTLTIRRQYATLVVTRDGGKPVVLYQR
jgi:hypothetical protein